MIVGSGTIASFMTKVAHVYIYSDIPITWPLDFLNLPIAKTKNHVPLKFPILKRYNSN